MKHFLIFILVMAAIAGGLYLFTSRNVKEIDEEFLEKIVTEREVADTAGYSKPVKKIIEQKGGGDKKSGSIKVLPVDKEAEDFQCEIDFAVGENVRDIFAWNRLPAIEYPVMNHEQVGTESAAWHLAADKARLNFISKGTYVSIVLYMKRERGAKGIVDLAKLIDSRL